MISRIFLTVLLLISLAGFSYADVSRPVLPENQDYSDTLQVLLNVPEDEIDLTWSKLVIDELIDEQADI